jgi:predicted nuclease of predicted toxin-antitoxin system
LQTEGFEVEDVRDVGLRGSSDNEVFRYAQERNLVILTEDLGFGNELRYPPRSHRGVLVARFPSEISTNALSDAIVAALKDISAEEIEGSLLIVEPGKVRIRRA